MGNSTVLDEQRLRSYWKYGYLAPVDILGDEEVAEGVPAYMDSFERMQKEKSIRIVRTEKETSGMERRVYQLRAVPQRAAFFRPPHPERPHPRYRGGNYWSQYSNDALPRVLQATSHGRCNGVASGRLLFSRE